MLSALLFTLPYRLPSREGNLELLPLSSFAILRYGRHFVPAYSGCLEEAPPP